MELNLTDAQKGGLCQKLAAIYNTAVQDMKKFMFTQLEDMEAIYEKE